jgi:site-specific DNA recombinase
MTRAAIYCRISSDPDDRREGVERQRQDCLEIAARRGWTVTPEREYIDNNRSAAKSTKKEREHYLRLLADIEAGKIDAVVMWAEDRLQRQLVELLEFLEVCEQAGVTKLASAGGEFDISNPDQRLNLKLKAAIAEAEIEKMRARMRRQRRGAAEKGTPHAGGSREFGTVGRRRVKTANGEVVTKPIVSEAQAARERELIREAAERILAGDDLRPIRREWTEAGIRTATGKVFANQTLRALLLSPRLAGYRAHHGEIMRDKDGHPVRLRGDDGQPVEPILKPAMWEAVCKVLRNPERITNHRGGLPRHLLSGFLFCGICGHRMYPRPRGDGFIYRCPPPDGSGGCGRVSRDAAKVERLIEAALFRAAESPQWDAAAADRPADDPTRPHAERLAELTAELDVLDRRIGEAELAEELARKDKTGQRRRPHPSSATLRGMLAEREAERDQHNAALARLQAGRVVAAIPRNLRAVWPDFSLERQRNIVRAVLRLPPEGKGIVIHPQRPLGPGGFDPEAIDPDWRQ